MSHSNYGYSKKVSVPFDKAIELTKQALKKEGFGVLTEIDIQNTLKQKINAEMEHYTILGACHPSSAYNAIQAEREIGLMLPCNVIVYQDNNEVFVSAIIPSVAMGMIKNDDLGTVAVEVEDKLKNAIDNI